jgi:DNA-binding beta-propeller fold protein YncE
MGLEHVGYVQLPPHNKAGGFDHAAVHRGSGRVYVAHTANDAVDMIDMATRRYVGSIQDLTGVAGVLVSDEPDLVFTSNRGENTVGIFSVAHHASLVRVPVGVRPNGLAYDPGSRRLLVANVGDPATPSSFTVSVVDVAKRERMAELAVAGRTRWTVFDPGADVFHVNIADPAQIAVISAADPVKIRRTVAVPSAGPHGLDLDVATRRLFCACDAGYLVQIDADSGAILNQTRIGGVPDVIFFNAERRRLYVAIGDPGLIEVFDTDSLSPVETIATERGAHTLAFDPASNTVYAFLPQTHRAAVYSDQG